MRHRVGEGYLSVSLFLLLQYFKPFFEICICFAHSQAFSMIIDIGLFIVSLLVLCYQVLPTLPILKSLGNFKILRIGRVGRSLNIKS